jgi:hypothetical protein
MVTGVETAGVVLAVVPLLILALEKWQNGLLKTNQIAGLRRKDRERLAAKIKRLATQLNWHDTQLDINLKYLFLTSNSEVDIEALPRDFKNQLWTNPVGQEVEKYLKRIAGENAVEVFKSVIEASERLVEEIAEHFEHGGRDPQVDYRHDRR